MPDNPNRKINRNDRLVRHHTTTVLKDGAPSVQAFKHREGPEPEQCLSFYHLEHWDDDPEVRTDQDRLKKILEHPGIRTIGVSHKLSIVPVFCIVDNLEDSFGEGVVTVEYLYAEDNPAHVCVTIIPEWRFDIRVADIIYNCVADLVDVSSLV